MPKMPKLTQGGFGERKIPRYGDDNSDRLFDTTACFSVELIYGAGGVSRCPVALTGTGITKPGMKVEA
jgi:hypothetical protein